MSIRWRVALAFTGLAILLVSLAVIAYVFWPRATIAYERVFTSSFLGFLRPRTRALTAAGVFGLVFGCTLGLPLAAYAVDSHRARLLLQHVRPNPATKLEKPVGLVLMAAEEDLLRALFFRYHRVVIEAELRSRNSVARTLLARPIRLDGAADPYTIAKIGESSALRLEFENYETYVKETVPQVTARIDSPPVVTKPRLLRRRSATASVQPASAALRYTLVGEPAESPMSLRKALLANPDPVLLEKLLSTLSANWWLRRRPYTFPLGLEYDRLLPTHFVLEPLPPGLSSPRPLNARAAPAGVELQLGDVVQLRQLRSVELRPDGQSLSLSGAPLRGQPPLRFRWMGLAPPDRRAARVLGTRDNLLHDIVVEFDRHGLPDPLEKLPMLLNEAIAGTQSTIHGDLNLDNILVGPGGSVWLIDFARTRKGHALFDLACLEASLIAQVISPLTVSDDEFLSLLERDDHPLRAALHAAVHRCLLDPARVREYQLPLFMACLGVLKYHNLDRRAKHHLYLTAAYLGLTL